MKTTLIALLLAFFSITAFAQRRNSDTTPEQRAEAQVKTMTEKLDLSEDQQKQIYNLTLARVQKVEELRSAQSVDREQMRSSMETFNNEIAKILTVEQQEKFKTMQDDRRGGGGGARGPRRGN